MSKPYRWPYWVDAEHFVWWKDEFAVLAFAHCDLPARIVVDCPPINTSEVSTYCFSLWYVLIVTDNHPLCTCH